MTDPAKSKVVGFFREAARRKVYTSAVAYLAVAMVLLQLGPPIFKALKLPDGSDNVLTVLLLLGFPVVLVLAWVFDIGPKGVHRTEDAPQPSVYRNASATWGAVEEEPELIPSSEPIVREAPDPDRVRRASLAFVRHELRTPINAIIGYSEMVLEDVRDGDDESAATDLARIAEGGRQLLHLVEDILDAERISAERRDMDSYSAQIRADLRDPLSAVIGYAEMLIESARERDLSEHVPDLERILSASHRLLALSTDIASVATQAPESNAALSRAQTLAEDVLSKIRAVPVGSGEEDRQGSLLIVDDSPMNRDLLARQLARKGYLVATADNGHDALARMAEQSFDVVLLDVVMPELDGIEVLQRMKNDRVLREIPVIMISALDEIDSVIRCLEIGAADFLSKPFHPTLLDVRINACLATRRTRERERALRAQLSGMTSNGASRVVGSIPSSVLQRLDAGERNVLDVVAQASVLWCDMDRALPQQADPSHRAALIARIMEAADRVARANDCEVFALHTGIGLSAGFPLSARDSAERLGRAAIALRDACGMIPGVRYGVHSGHVAGAAIGGGTVAYWLWGDAVDLARRLAGCSEAGEIMISPAAHTEMKNAFVFTKHSIVDVQGRGEMRPFLLQSALEPVAAR